MYNHTNSSFGWRSRRKFCLVIVINQMDLDDPVDIWMGEEINRLRR